KDIYVEADWMDCNLSRPGEGLGSCEPIVDANGQPDLRSFEPADHILTWVEDAFEQRGYNLHFVKGEAIPVFGTFVPGPNVPLGGPYRTADTAYNLPDATFEDAQAVYSAYFATSAERTGASGRPTASLWFKQKYFRYA